MKYRSTLLGEASGSIGGATASRNKGGQYFRQRTIPVNPATTLQSTARSAFGVGVNGWTALTDAQRAAWNNYAQATPWVSDFAVTMRLSGQQAFVRAASLVALGSAYGLADLSSLSAYLDGPTINQLGPEPDNDAQIFVGSTLPADDGLTITVGSQIDAADVVVAFLSSPVNPTKSFFKGPYTLVGASTPTAAQVKFPLDETNEGAWGIRNNPATEGQLYWGYLRVITPDGRVSTRVPFGPTIVQQGL